jgi:hypothetical protein
MARTLPVVAVFKVHMTRFAWFRRWLSLTVYFLNFPQQARSAALEFDEFVPVEYKLIDNGYGGLQWSNFFIWKRD